MATLYVYVYDEAAGLIIAAHLFTALIQVIESLPYPLRKRIVHIDFSLSSTITNRSFGTREAGHARNTRKFRKTSVSPNSFPWFKEQP
jgi:hypothetical protein